MDAFLLGYDLGSSSVKASLIDSQTGLIVASAISPEAEMEIISLNPGWAEQDPEMWWQEVINVTGKLKGLINFDLADVSAIGIAYQMHGLVMVDKKQKVLRPSIIWCDSRAVSIGQSALKNLGSSYCLGTLLNSPGNFTASKLRWIKENEPDVFNRIHKVMLPGDYIAMRMSGKIQTTASGLSEGILWDFKNQNIAFDLLDYYEIDKNYLPEIVPTFGRQTVVSNAAATQLGLNAGTPICYRAGDQPNNAFSLNVLKPGEVAATAGTSGVIYGITKQNTPDLAGRINTFVHSNSTSFDPVQGVLACVNGTGILNSWLRKLVGNLPYKQMDELASKAPIGSEKLLFFPFGNGAERILGNSEPGANLKNLSLTRHRNEHVLRAAQEGIVFALALGLGVMESVGVMAKVVRAGEANMFLSPVFREIFVNTTGATLELYNTDGAQGAARGAGIGAGIYKSYEEAFLSLECLVTTEPDNEKRMVYREVFDNWKNQLESNEFVNVNQ